MRLSRMRGVAAVELALVLPVFLMLMLATAELGRALYLYNTLTKSVRDGAQYIARNCLVAGSVDLSALTGHAADVTKGKNLIVYGQLTAGTALLTGMTTDDCSASTPVNENCVTVAAASPLGTAPYITVTAKYRFPALFGSIPAFPTGSGIAEPGVMTATITMAGLGP